MLTSTAFTTETAAEAARRSWLPGSARFTKQALPQPAPIPATPIPATATSLPSADRVRAQMEQIMSLMEATDDPKQKDAFSRAFDRLFRAWAHLTGMPGPGQRKPATIRGRNNASGPGGFHVPAEPSNCGPDTPTSGMPAENSVSQTPQGTNTQ